MAQSPAHRFGQIIGDTLEQAVRPIFESIASELGFYLDGKGERKARGTKRKVAWVDGKGNTHDLDYVFEFDGTDEQIGVPKAFIEIAWRRYTKHSRNKAQEIQGAILPLAEHHVRHHPFLRVVLGGVFTTGSLNQLRSHGFSVLYIPYQSIIDAFQVVGIDAAFDEATSDSSLSKRVSQYQKLTAANREKIAQTLRALHKAEIDVFMGSLRTVLTRKVERIDILPLHGEVKHVKGVSAAIAFIEAFNESRSSATFARFEICLRYSNGDEIRGSFIDKSAAVGFLRSMR